MRFGIVIPARLASTRLPEKLLLAETGKSVLEHTYISARKAKTPERVVVAVDHQKLFDEVMRFGGTAIMTDVNAQSGTDRVSEVCRSMPEIDAWINVQGDEPEIEASAIDLAADLLKQDSSASVATLATPIRTRSNFEDPGCVKVVLGHDRRALYFSRSPIPHPREWNDQLLSAAPSLFLQHIGLYVYRREFLTQLDQLPESPLEKTEKLEQLRFLQAGHKIAVGIIPSSPRGIDTRPDYDAFVARWNSRS
jgi:3-deoxy-manno-octulosonate cytidylyltransferase (CMP-KDO synthetase)